ncbi:MAG: 3-keto-disaccharide hydrolase [Sphingomonas sp.]
MQSIILGAGLLLAAAPLAVAAQQSGPKPQDTEQWSPAVPVVTPGNSETASPPSDAIVLFDGTSLAQWAAVKDGSPAGWAVADGAMTVVKQAGNIQTRRSFGSYQLHLEYRIPADVTGSGQERGNSGLFLASTGPGDAGYELQILDSYHNDTYVNGQAGSVYKQYPPLVNPVRKPGEWQRVDVIWTKPTFAADGSVKSPAYVTAFINGVLVQDHVALHGETLNTGTPSYKPYDRAPIKLQAHGDPSPPLSFRNIWVRELDRAAG